MEVGTLAGSSVGVTPVDSCTAEIQFTCSGVADDSLYDTFHVLQVAWKMEETNWESLSERM